jgi:hypothetical protein
MNSPAFQARIHTKTLPFSLCVYLYVSLPQAHILTQPHTYTHTHTHTHTHTQIDLSCAREQAARLQSQAAEVGVLRQQLAAAQEELRARKGHADEAEYLHQQVRLGGPCARGAVACITSDALAARG